MSDHACKIYATLEFELSGLQVKGKRESIMSLMHGFYERGGPMIRMHHELRQISYSPSAGKKKFINEFNAWVLRTWTSNDSSMHHELRQIKYSPSAPKRTADSSLPNVKSFVQIERDRPVFRLH